MKGRPSLVIKTSQIPKAGKGLYTTRKILKGEVIGEYTGKLLSTKVIDKDEDKYAENYYLFDIGNGVTIDGEKSKSKTRYINDASGLTRIKGLSNNSSFHTYKRSNTVLLRAKRDIKPGEEIFASYGRDYWKAVKYNIENNLI